MVAQACIRDGKRGDRDKRGIGIVESLFFRKKWKMPEICGGRPFVSGLNTVISGTIGEFGCLYGVSKRFIENIVSKYCISGYWNIVFREIKISYFRVSKYHTQILTLLNFRGSFFVKQSSNVLTTTYSKVLKTPQNLSHDLRDVIRINLLQKLAPELFRGPSYDRLKVRKSYFRILKC